MQLVAVCLHVLFSCEVEAIPNRYGIETWKLVFSSSGSNFDAAFFFCGSGADDVPRGRGEFG